MSEVIVTAKARLGNVCFNRPSFKTSNIRVWLCMCVCVCVYECAKNEDFENALKNYIASNEL